MNEHDAGSKYRMRNLIAERLREGKCICGREKTQGFYRCVRCMEKQKIDRDRLKDEGKVIISVKNVKNHRLYDRMTNLKIGTKDMAQMIGVHQRTVWAWITQGTVPGNEERIRTVNSILNMDVF